MESQPQNPEFRINLENFHPCSYNFQIILQGGHSLLIDFFLKRFDKFMLKQCKLSLNLHIPYIVVQPALR